MSDDVIKALTPATFPAWLALAEKHNGVWGGCYCSSFHGDTDGTVKADYDRATFKRRLADEGVAHAALVFDGDQAIAWREYGSAGHLPPQGVRCGVRTIMRRGASRASSSTATTDGKASHCRRSRAPST
ncbi:hypothetical protein [Pseudolysinimonas sp.]